MRISDGVQTCALPIFLAIRRSRFHPSAFLSMAIGTAPAANPVFLGGLARRLVADKLISDAQAREAQQRAIKDGMRSEERRVGKEWVSKCESRGSPEH